MATYRIATIPGDGIGPEIVAETLLVLEKVGAKFGHQFVFETADAGGCAIDKFGEALPATTIATCKNSDAVLLGAIGGWKWDTLPGDQRPERALLGLRSELGLFCNLRPAAMHAALKDACPLRADIVAGGINMMIVRELTGGIYFGQRGRIAETPLGPAAWDTEQYAVEEVRRIAVMAFQIARGRKKHVTSIDKANVLESSRLWREVVVQVAADFPDVTLDHLYIDNATMQLIRDPGFFDVIVTSNMFGDIISDEASQITGSIGMLPSASLNKDGFGMYEPIHGSAPDIAGQNIANPIATILSGAMLLRHSFALEAEAAATERAVETVLAQNLRTADIMSPGMTRVGTREMGQAVVDAIN